jgi:hypothetical protein
MRRTALFFEMFITSILILVLTLFLFQFIGILCSTGLCNNKYVLEAINMLLFMIIIIIIGIIIYFIISIFYIRFEGLSFYLLSQKQFFVPSFFLI